MPESVVKKPGGRFQDMPELIRTGHVYLAQPPLYKVERNKKVWYAYNDAQLEEIMQDGNFGQFDARTVRPENETFWHRNVRKFRRQLRFVKYYPGEVFGAPIWKTWHLAWRMVNR